MSIDEKIAARSAAAIEQQVFPGCVVGLIRANERIVLPFGTLRYEGGELVTEHTMYDLASVTKSIPVASLVLSFIAEGKIALDDGVTKYLPKLQNDFRATIEDLLRYRVHGPRMSTLGHPTFEQIRTHILESGFDGPPAEEKYTNLPAFLLGLILERISGQILPALADAYFFQPLGMADTTFFPHDVARIAPTEIVHGEEICAIVHDESARVFSHARRAVGHAGLFSTGPDILKFLQALLNNRYPAIVEGAEKGLGWQTGQDWWMGEHSRQETFGKTGFTGTSVLVDRKKETAFVILSNRTFPVRPADAASLTSAINIFRSDIADVILS